MYNQSYTTYEFCAAERLSRAMLYKLWAEGQGPRWFQIGNRRRISHEARIEWRRQLEAEAEARRTGTTTTTTAIGTITTTGVRDGTT